MPRRNRAKREELRPHSTAGYQRGESGPDGDWYVRSVTGSTKVYRCPGCDHEIQAGVPHVVAWQADGTVDDRRHWHRACWDARLRRGPTSRRW
ncbi:hypothetical protein [Actinocrispum wychmicini]|uniref:hypothetical protein n=1 Tax=Actinocrispum wychmicini TaxID=1213861 RepID=UPI00140498FB|nr:hypothetical protein [Actinocrispum wychmicini]